jgi:hypothetical protein
MTNRGIDLSTTLGDLFREQLDDALRSRRREVPAPVRDYVVRLLCSFSLTEPLGAPPFERPLTFVLDDARSAGSPAERLARLRALGDRALWLVGFFADHLERRGASRSYVVGIGRTAYAEAAAAQRARRRASTQTPDAPASPTPDAVTPAAQAPGSDVLGALADDFLPVSRAISDIADGALAAAAGRTPEALVDLYSRFLRSGSAVVGSRLASLGVVPVGRVGRG